MDEFFNKYWLELSTLLIAVLGGVPGGIVVINFLRRRIYFGFNLEGFDTGNIGASGKSMLLLTGTVTNKGDRPLRPDNYGLEIKIQGSWVKLEPTQIPTNPLFESDQQHITYADINRRDLQIIDEAVTSISPVRGHLMFLSTLELKNIRAADRLRLTCIDVYKRIHKVKIDLKRIKPDLNKPIIYPKHGVTVIPK